MLPSSTPCSPFGYKRSTKSGAPNWVNFWLSIHWPLWNVLSSTFSAKFHTKHCGFTFAFAVSESVAVCVGRTAFCRPLTSACKGCYGNHGLEDCAGKIQSKETDFRLFNHVIQVNFPLHRGSAHFTRLYVVQHFHLLAQIFTFLSHWFLLCKELLEGTFT